MPKDNDFYESEKVKITKRASITLYRSRDTIQKIPTSKIVPKPPTTTRIKSKLATRVNQSTG